MNLEIKEAVPGTVAPTAAPDDDDDEVEELSSHRKFITTFFKIFSTVHHRHPF